MKNKTPSSMLVWYTVCELKMSGKVAAAISFWSLASLIKARDGDWRWNFDVKGILPEPKGKELNFWGDRVLICISGWLRASGDFLASDTWQQIIPGLKTAFLSTKMESWSQRNLHRYALLNTLLSYCPCASQLPSSSFSLWHCHAWHPYSVSSVKVIEPNCFFGTWIFMRESHVI